MDEDVTVENAENEGEDELWAPPEYSKLEKRFKGAEVCVLA